ncbi:MAG: hypothetical protein IGS03_08580 [Candidatus Sericytochromatia bacterium]|nr:hypothetical protein [Candidatus Sericytochromatia bacterium]
MFKRIAGFMVVLSMVFAFQASAWAAAVNAQDTTVLQQSEVIALAENPQLAALNSDLQLLGATGFGGMKIEPWFWALSIVVPGLGQFLMGDMVKGLLFFFGPTLVGIAASVVTGVLVSMFASNPGIVGILPLIGTILGLLALAVYVWNVVDAYFMNQEKTGMASIESLDMEKLSQDIQRIAEFAQKNQIVALEGGAALNHQVATF